MNNIYVESIVYPRNNRTFDATVLISVVDYSSSEKPEILHKYVRLGFHSRKDCENFAYLEALTVQDRMIAAARDYLSKYKDAQ